MSSSSQHAQPDLGNAAIDAREFGAEASPVALFSARGDVRLIIDALLGDPRFALVFTFDRVLVHVERREWWAFCSTCWSVLAEATTREVEARDVVCQACDQERRAAAFIDRVAHVLSMAPAGVSTKVTNFERR